MLPLLSAAAMIAASLAPQTAWEPCQLGPEGEQVAAECATVGMPLDHESGEGTMGIAVARVRGGGETHTQVWFLDGGPGDAGIDTLPRLAPLLAEPGIDVYTLDHRGVGRSGLLRCEAQQAADSAEGNEITAEEWPACIEAITAQRADLDALTASQAAYDVLELIRANRQDGARVVLLGVSYGSYWAQRVLQLDPQAIDGVVLDGIVPPDWTFAEFDAALDAMTRDLLGYCADDAECSEHLGADPAAMAAALPARIDAGHCPDLQIDGATVRLLLGNMIMGGEDVWPYIPATIYRFDRCRLRDLLAIGEMFARLFESGDVGAELPSHSPVLQRHVAMSELWPQSPPSTDELDAAIASAVATTGVSASFSRTYDAWPRYERPAGRERLPDYTGPMLLLHGSLDPTVRPQRLQALLRHYSATGQTAAIMPGGGHVLLGDSNCARAVTLAFLRDPATPPDLGCVLAGRDPLQPPVGTASPFGTDDLYGGWPSDLEILLGAVAVAVIGGGIASVWWWRRRLQRRGKAAHHRAGDEHGTL